MESLFGDDPATQKSLIGKSVNIITVDKEIHEGILYVVDPISKTIMLLNESKKSLKLLLPHAIASVEVKHQEDTVQANLCSSNALLFESDIEERRIRLKNWFKKNLIDVTEDGLILKIQDSFHITPPYTIEQCVCNNKQILERMISLIERMP